jgi:hypothetical protein
VLTQPGCRLNGRSWVLSNFPIQFIVYHDDRIDPGSAFRLLVKIAKYVADADRYGLVEIPEQEHELWLGTNSEYSIARFHEELATKMFWGAISNNFSMGS